MKINKIPAVKAIKAKFTRMVQLLLTAIEKLYNSIKYNGFYIFLALLFPLIIFEFDAGEEIIVSMTETAFLPNIILSLAAFAALAYSVWCIPTLAIKFFQFITSRDKQHNKLVKLCLFKQLIYVYNGLDDNDTSGNQPDAIACVSTAKKRLQIPIRYFAIAPWILFIATCVKVFFRTDYVWGLVAVAFVFLCSMVYLINHFKTNITSLLSKLTKSRNGHIRPRRFVIVPAVMLAAILFSWTIFARQQQTGPEEAAPNWEYLVIILHSLAMLLFYSFIVYMENEKFEKATAYKISNVSYKAVIVFLAGCIIAFYFANEHQAIGYVSPINVIIIISTALIIFFEFFFTSQHLLISIIDRACASMNTCLLKPEKNEARRLQGYRYILYALLFVLVFQFFFSALNEHRIRLEASVDQQHAKRDSLTVYFDRWLANRKLPADDSVVYLVSGQGGGSRAAAHFFITMARIQKTYPDFFKKVFCLSTASGSTSGAQMFLASQYYHKSFTSDASIQEMALNLYGRNYMSSAFYGMLVGDGIEYFTSGSGNAGHDRNYHLQKEELAGFRAAFGHVDPGFFEKDFMYPYKDTSRHWPLFLINTTVVDYGVRGVFSPVIGNFSLARDLYGEFAKDNSNDKKDLPLVTCVNQSQAFPLLSAYNYLECTGRLADGGVAENTGCASTLEVYEAIRLHCNSTGRKNVKIICLNIYNSSLAEDIYAPFKKASILNTVNAVAKGPFSGAQFYAYKNLSKKMKYLNSFKLEINPRDTVIDFGLDTSVTLTRTLSKRAVRTIFDNITGDTSKKKTVKWDTLMYNLRKND